MNLDRRDFLRWFGAGAAGALAAPAWGAGFASTRPALPTYDEAGAESFWRAVRACFPLDPDLAYFNTGGLGPASSPVLELFTQTMLAHQRESDTGYESFAPARVETARFFAVTPEEIAFVRNTTEGNAIVAAGLALGPGDEVIFESHAHPGGSFPWFNQSRLRGVTVKLFDPDPASAAGNVRRIRDLITSRTRVIQVSHVTAPTGIVMPVAAIAELAHAHGAWFHVDGAQSAGMFPFGLRELGCDSFATSGHKWLGGPHETGVFFIRRDRMDALSPVEVGAHSGRLPFLPGTLRYAPTAARFEYGTRNAASVVALAAALRWQESIGRARIGDRGRALANRVRAGLEGIPDIEILTPRPPELRGSIVPFRTPRMDFSDLFDKLWKGHRARCRPVSEQKLNAVRVSTHLFNSPAECDRLVAAVAEILGRA
jgi:selenocysteine lyase/cysteine desulfurase